MKTIKKAIVSVFDKSGVIEFVKTLINEYGVEILSTGGTGRLLEENGINYIKISSYTESPEMFDGRVKTLHPKIEGGILYRRTNSKDVEDAEKYNIPPIDMVVCNLYQFKEAISRPDITLSEALEMIDIGGPTMIRAAAKNFPDVIVIPDSKYYKGIIKELKANNGAISDKTRANLAQQVFTIMADYNATIVNYLKNYYYPDEKMGTQLVKIFEKLQDCRYGENWDQAAAYYRDVNAKHGLHDLKKLGG
ncbi:MAG: bifunctional phosphoribosylaminoimidazolecarboxamide formyltransferase/IMP cyclohydrolase, partial [Promethearchaeota archaeon]